MDKNSEYRGQIPEKGKREHVVSQQAAPQAEPDEAWKLFLEKNGTGDMDREGVGMILWDPQRERDSPTSIC